MLSEEPTVAPARGLLTIPVPISLPSAERLEEICREEFAKVATERAKWMRFDEAAKHLRISFRTFERKKAKWGLPVYPLDGDDGVKVVAIEDLDALVRSKVVKSNRPSIIPFPSLVGHGEQLQNFG